jgi:hypothetical protein
VKAQANSTCQTDATETGHVPRRHGYSDKITYRAIHFHGARLADSLSRASDFLLQLEKQLQREPYPLCISVQYSAEDDWTETAWQVTVVLGELLVDANDPDRR